MNDEDTVTLGDAEAREIRRGILQIAYREMTRMLECEAPRRAFDHYFAAVSADTLDEMFATFGAAHPRALDILVEEAIAAAAVHRRAARPGGPTA
ncbi:hypothetical protein [Anaeromyxobacter sp. SG66]|uniref:hypothetical protein n=1 Tax=Anaeromyxobacter sp. SG66 TaxID=2925410 RepID=UPI001F582147|nr:hypothetical protein [Anaeromyxobacter sp. SG66]